MKEKQIKMVRLLPMVMLGIFLLRTLYTWCIHQHVPTLYHYWAIGLFLVTAFLYFIRFNYGVAMTGLMLLLACFGLLVFDPERILIRYSVNMNDSPVFSFPFVSRIMILMTLFYVGVNLTFFMSLYRRYRFDRRKNHQPEDNH